MELTPRKRTCGTQQASVLTRDSNNVGNLQHRTRTTTVLGVVLLALLCVCGTCRQYHAYCYGTVGGLTTLFCCERSVALLDPSLLRSATPRQEELSLPAPMTNSAYDRVVNQTQSEDRDMNSLLDIFCARQNLCITRDSLHTIISDKFEAEL